MFLQLSVILFMEGHAWMEGCVTEGVCTAGSHVWLGRGACMAGGVCDWSHARPLYGWLVGGTRPIRMLTYSLLKVLLNLPQFVAISSQTILSVDGSNPEFKERFPCDTFHLK